MEEKKLNEQPDMMDEDMAEEDLEALAGGFGHLDRAQAVGIAMPDAR